MFEIHKEIKCNNQKKVHNLTLRLVRRLITKGVTKDNRCEFNPIVGDLRNVFFLLTLPKYKKEKRKPPMKNVKSGTSAVLKHKSWNE